MSKIIIGGHEVTAQKDYSTSEVFTGQYWIDGKKIYRKFIEIKVSDMTTVTTYARSYSISSLNIESIVSVTSGRTDGAGHLFAIAPELAFTDNAVDTSTGWNIIVNTNNIGLYMASVAQTRVTYIGVILEYTKS